MNAYQPYQIPDCMHIYVHMNENDVRKKQMLPTPNNSDSDQYACVVEGETLASYSEMTPEYPHYNLLRLRMMLSYQHICCVKTRSYTALSNQAMNR